MTQLNLINLKTVFVYEIGLIAIREVSPPFNEEQQYGSTALAATYFYKLIIRCTFNPD